ncbi:EmrB/QacA subfamily drug resistance transporter [Streptomyces sp. SLBN-118]|uniref:MFS transporter n=1 Tax=Streptomyces sp. SLBN-118 TaxID=2768454 RepID=UPI0011507065|nr:MFS transporter [Streptomyces sp. SLBN-118]TQK42576.1 EmrB/QacA subfamily drug resistance transporter [Streptomyces sp. SLBN-118]
MSTAYRRLTLTGSVVGAAVVALDGTVLTIVQPAMQRDLHVSFHQVQWTSTVYLIAVASLLVFAGRIGDRYGHRQVFAVGILGFGAASWGIGQASGIGWVIVLRVSQGVFGALLQPATLGMLRAAFPPDRLGMPVALRTSAIGVAAAAGPLVGGALAARFDWRAVFLLNVVPALVIGVLVLAVREPAVRDAKPAGASAHRLDLPGACLLAVTLGSLVHTLVSMPESSRQAATVTGFVVAAVAGGAFVCHERRTQSPLVAPEVLGSVTVASALGILVSASAVLFGALFAGTYFLQGILGLNPFRSALTALPGAAAMVLAAPLAAVLMRRYGPRRTTATAMSLLAFGALLLSRLDGASATVAICAGFFLVGAGFGSAMVTATAVIVSHAPAEHAGVVGGLQQTALNIGPIVGIAAATALMTLGSRGEVPGGSGAAFISAMGPALIVLAAVAAAGAILASGLPGRTTGSASPRPRTAA